MDIEEKFTPSFKEKGEEQYYYKDDIWVKCSESLIDSLWSSWVSSKNSHRFYDEEGFLVYGYKNIVEK